MISSKKKGDSGELIAINYLLKLGFKLESSNFKFGRFGEIDLIVSKNYIYHFIEVKYRENTRYGTAEESITKNKLRKFGKTIEYYVKTHKLDFENIQFDVITITKEKKSYKLTHYKNLEL